MHSALLLLWIRSNHFNRLCSSFSSFYIILKIYISLRNVEVMAILMKVHFYYLKTCHLLLSQLLIIIAHWIFWTNSNAQNYLCTLFLAFQIYKPFLISLIIEWDMPILLKLSFDFFCISCSCWILTSVNLLLLLPSYMNGSNTSQKIC